MPAVGLYFSKALRLKSLLVKSFLRSDSLVWSVKVYFLTMSLMPLFRLKLRSME